MPRKPEDKVSDELPSLRRKRSVAELEEVDEIDYSVKDKIATITINREDKLNVISYDMFDAIYDCVSRAELNGDVNAIQLRGAGENFCAGFDVGEEGGYQGIYDTYDAVTEDEEPGERRPSERAYIHHDTQIADNFRKLMFSLKPIISRIDGWCIGGGVYLNYCSDISICSESAKFSLQQKRMVGAGTDLTEYEMLLIGPKKSRELGLTGRKVSSDEAKEMGLVNTVVPDGDLDEEVDRYCEAMKNLPLDAIVASQVRSKMALEALGVGQGMSVNNAVGHAVGQQVRVGSSEFEFLNDDDEGVAGPEVLREINEQFDELGF